MRLFDFVYSLQSTIDGVHGQKSDAAYRKELIELYQSNVGIDSISKKDADSICVYKKLNQFQ